MLEEELAFVFPTRMTLPERPKAITGCLAFAPSGVSVRGDALRKTLVSLRQAASGLPAGL